MRAIANILFLALISVSSSGDGWIQIGNWPRSVQTQLFADPKLYRVGLVIVDDSGQEQAVYPQTEFFNFDIPRRWFALPRAVKISGKNPGDSVTARLVLYIGEFWEATSNTFVAELAAEPPSTPPSGLESVVSPVTPGYNYQRYLDPTFTPELSRAGGNGDLRVPLLLARADGKLMVAGNFSEVNGASTTQFVRLNADGSIDPTFTNKLPAIAAVELAAFQSDGKIVAGGSYSGATFSHFLVRLMPDGEIDPTFHASIEQQATALYLDVSTASLFVALAGNPPKLALLDTNGTPSAEFSSPVFENGANSALIHAISPSPSGGFWIGGDYTTVNGENRGALVAIDAQGRVTSDASAPLVGGPVYSISGELIGGAFEKINGEKSMHLARIHRTNIFRGWDALFDPAWPQPNKPAYDLPVVTKVLDLGSSPSGTLLVQAENGPVYVVDVIGPGITEIRGDAAIQSFALQRYGEGLGHDNIIVAGPFTAASTFDRFEMRKGIGRYVRYWDLSSRGVNLVGIYDGIVHIVPRGFGGEIEYSTDLKTWSPLKSRYFDSPDAPQKFYRRRKDW